jgi:signal transduction histidine kinase/ActR/RegA family two-component response regulator
VARRAPLTQRDVWLLVATLGFFLAAVGSAYHIYRSQATLLSSIRTGNWLVVEANSEFHNALDASKSFRLDPTAESLDRLKTRFDVFWSRIPLILESDEGVGIRKVEVVVRNTEQIAEVLPKLDEEMARIVAERAESALPFEIRLNGLEPLLEEMVRVLLVQDQARYRVDDIARGSMFTGALFGLSVLAGFGLAIVNLLQRRRVQSLYQQQVEIDQARATQLTAIESSGEGIAMFDAEGRLSYSNEAFHHLIGDDFSRTLTRERWRRFVTRDGAKTILRGLKSAGIGQAWKGEVAGCSLDGAEHDWEVAITRSPEGGFVALFRDLAERKANERERALMQEQLHRVDKMDAVGRLAGGVAHDFNNILAAITGFGSLLQFDLEKQPEQRGMIDQIMIAAGRGKELVQSIMTFSRAEKADRRVTDVAAACREAATMAAVSIEGPAVFETSIDAGQIPVQANATQITRAIVNLCMNARDALENGHGTIRLEVTRVDIDGGRSSGLRGRDGAKSEETVVRFEAVAPDRARGWIGTLDGAGPHVRIRVSDEGSGMPLHVMERIFDPFFTTKEVGRGTGLGLSSVLGIVSAHRGAIAVDSTMGKGTTFDLLLPIESAQAEPAQPSVASAPAPLAEERQIAGCRILVVDDDVEAGQALVGVLDKIGCEPSFCQGGAEALELLRDEPEMFDLVMTDMQMPQMTGLDLAARLRERGYRRPIVLVSGRPQDAPMQERARVGIELVLPKPYTLREVAGIVWSGVNQAETPAPEAPRTGASNAA